MLTDANYRQTEKQLEQQKLLLLEHTFLSLSLPNVWEDDERGWSIHYFWVRGTIDRWRRLTIPYSRPPFLHIKLLFSIILSLRTPSSFPTTLRERFSLDHALIFLSIFRLSSKVLLILVYLVIFLYVKNSLFCGCELTSSGLSMFDGMPELSRWTISIWKWLFHWYHHNHLRFDWNLLIHCYRVVLFCKWHFLAQGPIIYIRN
jgi:hypothetical protein